MKTKLKPKAAGEAEKDVHDIHITLVGDEGSGAVTWKKKETKSVFFADVCVCGMDRYGMWDVGCEVHCGWD